MKIVRVLVYEGEEADVIAHLQRRSLKKQGPRPLLAERRDSPYLGGVVITEAFVDQASIDTLLGEYVSTEDVEAAEDVVGADVVVAAYEDAASAVEHSRVTREQEAQVGAGIFAQQAEDPETVARWAREQEDDERLERGHREDDDVV